MKNTTHRSSLNGRPLCGSTAGRISSSGVVVTCAKCRAESAPMDRAAAMASIEAAALAFRASRA